MLRSYTRIPDSEEMERAQSKLVRAEKLQRTACATSGGQHQGTRVRTKKAWRRNAPKIFGTILLRAVSVEPMVRHIGG